MKAKDDKILEMEEKFKAKESELKKDRDKLRKEFDDLKKNWKIESTQQKKDVSVLKAKIKALENDLTSEKKLRNPFLNSEPIFTFIELFDSTRHQFNFK